MARTYEEVWDLMHALIASQQETDRKFQETERLLKQQSQDTDRKFQETDHRFQETERLLKQQSQDTDRKFQETNRKFQDTDRKIKEVAAQIGKLGNRLGDFVEEMVRPALVRIFRARGLDVHHVVRGMTAYDDKRRVLSEVDLIASDTTIAVVVECKSQLSIDDVNEHLHRLALFKTHFPNYAGMQIFGAVAAMVLPDNVGQYASRKGLYLLVQSGEAVIIHNDAEFAPMQF